MAAFALGLTVGSLIMGAVAMGINVMWYHHCRRLNEDWYEHAKKVTDGWKETIEHWRISSQRYEDMLRGQRP